MAYDTGWQYNPNQNVGDQLSTQIQAEGNPRVAGDNGNATASSPFLSKSLQVGQGDGLTGGYSSWGATGQSITNTDLQAANNQTALLAYKQANDNYKAQQKRLQGLIDQAEKQGKIDAAKAYQREQVITQNIHGQVNSNQNNYNYNAGGGSGGMSSDRGLSSQGQSQLRTAQSDGYNLSAANYDRTYQYNNSFSADRNSALSQAYSWLGTHYVLDGESKQVEVDCSGLVQAIYSKLGFDVPLHSAEHEKDTIPGVRTAFANLQPGDLVCWKDGSHIAIYAGHGQIIEAANTRVGTVRRALWDDPSNVVGIHLTFADERGSRGQRQQVGG
jgi:cell wall-associated NlpC family hydrolase